MPKRPKFYEETSGCQMYLKLKDANLEYRIKTFETKQNELKSLYFLIDLANQMEDSLMSNFPRRNLGNSGFCYGD